MTKYDTNPVLKRIQDYVEDGYQQYVRRRNEFRDEKILSAELRSFLDFYEDRYRAERNAKGQ